MSSDENLIDLSPSIHGRSQARGRLLLSEKEVKIINQILASGDYSFQLLVEDASDSNLENVKSAENKVVSESKIVLPKSNKKRVKHTTPYDSNKRLHQNANSKKSGTNNKSEASSKITLSATPVTRMSRRLRKSITGSWIDACSAVTNMLEKEPASRWLKIDQVNTPGYIEKVTVPMNLQTVQQKLAHGLYTHPFRWQEDIRTIFYNVFTCYPEKSTTWQETVNLANFFEQLCKDCVGVNPYAVYAPATSATSNTPNKSETRKTKVQRSAGVSELKSKSKRSETIVLETSKLRELLAKVAAAASSNVQPTEPDENTPICLADYSDVTLPSPSLPQPPLPPVETLRPGEKGPSVVHKKLSQTQFRQLDVHLRFALLETVKDEFGVSSTAAACDPDFVIDFELLPYLKQKLIVVYLRTLHAFQQKCIEKGYKPTLVPHLQPKHSRKSVSNFCSNLTPKIVYDDRTTNLEKDPIKMTTPVPNKVSSSSSSSTVSFDSSSSSSSSDEGNIDGDDALSLSEVALYDKTPNPNYYSVESAEYYGDRGKSVPYKIKSPRHQVIFEETGNTSDPYPSYYTKDQQLYSVHGKTRPAMRSQLEEKLYESPEDDGDDFANTSDVAKSVSSSWGEWKAKAIQNKIQLKMGDEKNKDVLSVGDSERERDAELANAEI